MKISFKEAACILYYKKKHTFEKLACVHRLSYDEEGNLFTLTCDISWPVFILLYIPALIVEFVGSAWDCGIKYTSQLERNIYRETFFSWEQRYRKCAEVYKKHGVEIVKENEQ